MSNGIFDYFWLDRLLKFSNNSIAVRFSYRNTTSKRRKLRKAKGRD